MTHVFEELEPRIMYSADFAPALADDAGWLPHAEVRSLDDDADNAFSTQNSAARLREIFFVDASVQDHEQLIQDIQRARRSQGDAEIVLLDATRDGVEQIAQVLAQHQAVDAVHIIAHGDNAALQLGSARLSSETLVHYRDTLAQWAPALSADADILLYGCNVAREASGQAFVQRLAQLTGADVAASDDATGNPASGADWVLEQRTGTIEAASVFDAPRQPAWSGLLGNEFQVNTTTNNQQDTAALTRGSQQAVAYDSAGNFVVVWTSKAQDNGASTGVYARRFASDGTALTGEIQVNATTAGDQNMARVVSDAGGNFVVTWTSAGQDGNATGVYARRFDASGAALTGEIAVNTTTTGDQRNSVIGMNRSSGEFVVVWEGQGSGDAAGIFFRRFAADGTAVDAVERRANLIDGGAEANPAAAMDSSGRFVVAFEVGSHMYFQCFDAAGVAQGGRTQVDSGLTNDTGAAIAMDDAGNFTLVYRAQTVFIGVWGRGYLADGTQRYSWFQAATGDADSPSIAMAGDGAFIVTYQQTGTGGIDIYARKYQSDGSVNGSAFIVNQTTTSDQTAPSIALLDIDNFAVVWSGPTASDTSGVSARLFSPPNTPPVISLPSSALNYTENAAATVIDASVTVADVDSLNFNTGTLTVDFSANGTADDRLAIRNQGTGAGQIGVTGSNITYGGIVIGSFIGGTNGSTPLVVTFNASATPATAQALARNITYQNASDAPSTLARTVRFVVNDGDGGTSVAATESINVNAVNDTPMLANPIANQSATEDAGFNFQFAVNTFNDVDAGDTLAYSASSVPSWLTFNAATRTFSGTPANADVGTHTITVRATDGSGAFVEGSFDIVVGNTNDVPTVASPIANQSATEDAVFNFQFAANTFADVDAGDLLTYSASGVPSWLTFNAGTRTFSGTPTNADVGTTNITVRATDGSGAFVEESFDIVVANSNDTPTIANPIADQSATEDSSFSFQFPANSFADVDAGDTLTYTASGVPSWLTFNAATRTFSGTPTNADVGITSITARATDLSGAFVEDTFNIVVGNSNDAPTVSNPIANQSATEDNAFSFQFAANTFNDVDAGDNLIYSANSVPAWLSFDAATRTFSGTPANADVGTISITVRASDGSAAFVEDTFDIVVGNTNDAPTVATAIANQSATEDAAFSFQFAANTFADADLGDTLTYSASGVPMWLSFDAATRTFAGTPVNVDVGSATITVRATDGSSAFAEERFDIVVGNSNDAPTLANPLGAQAATQGAPFSLSFASTFADVDVGDPLTYTASGAPAWLTFDAATRSFAGTPGNADVGTATLTVRATDPSGAFVEDTFDIVVANANDAPVATDNTYSISEDIILDLNASGILQDDIDIDGDILSAALVNAPTNGSLVLNADGSLRYIPNADFNGVDTFSYRASDGALVSNVATVTINVAAVNDVPAIAANVLTLSENGAVTLSASELNSVDPEQTAGQLTYTVTAVAGGRFEFVGNADVAIASFTQDDINAGRVRFVHDGGEGAPSYQITVSDGGASDGPRSAVVNFTNVNDAPVLLANSGAQVGPGGTLGLSAAALTTTDVDNTTQQLIYTVIAAPNNGQLELSTNPGVAILQFTQADVDAGRLRYVSNAAQDFSDSFSFIVSDGSDTTVAATFVISANVPNPTPIAPSKTTPSVPLALPVVAADPIQQSPATSSKPVTQTVRAAPPDAARWLIPVRDGDDRRDAPAVRLDDGASSAAREQPFARTLVDTSARPRAREAFASTPIKVGQITFSDAQRQQAAAITSGGSTSPTLQAELSDSRYVEKLNQVRDQMREQLAIDKSVVGSSIALSTGLSVGYVIWLLRGGVLLSSLLSSLPAWGMVDPLPILGKLKNDDEADDQESLQDILKRVSTRSTALRRAAPRGIGAQSGSDKAPSLSSAKFLEEVSTGNV
jgi:Domain of unknown function (DUF4347)/Cadherin-like/Bacterial Ig domain/Putative Ig domain